MKDKNEEIKMKEKRIFSETNFQNTQTDKRISPKCFEKKSLSDELFLHYSSKVQNLTVFFSIIYMIRIGLFGSEELIHNGFRAARYSGSTKR